VTGVVIALVVIVVALVLYIERQLHPWRKCPRCDGTGKVNRIGPVSETWAVCRRCGGRKEVRRFLAPKR